MAKAEKLFQKAEIEYITPFLRLWLSFNSWYKKDSEADTPPIRWDEEAINKYRLGGKIKHHFLRLFGDTSNVGLSFKEAIKKIVLNIEETYILNDRTGNRVKYTLLIENPPAQTITRDNLLTVSKGSKEYYIRNDQKEDFFSETFYIVYKTRCSLVHGDFDIENQYFLNLVESSYNILYPIMQRILE
jgi:hypothetical protein